MTKQKIFGVVVGLMILIVVGAGYMLHKHNENESMLDEQDRMVGFIASNYKDIEKVEFTEIDYNNMTGTYSFYAVINDKIIVDFTLWGVGGEIDMSELSSRNSGNYLVKTNKTDEKSKISDIKIIYLEE